MSIEEHRVLSDMERHLRAEEPELVAVFDSLEPTSAGSNDPGTRGAHEPRDLIILLVVVVFLAVASMVAVISTEPSSPGDQRPRPARYVVNVPPDQQPRPPTPLANLPATRW